MGTQDSRGWFIDILCHLQICRINPLLQARVRLLLTVCAGGLTTDRLLFILGDCLSGGKAQAKPLYSSDYGFVTL
jgi:hypothetical protein